MAKCAKNSCHLKATPDRPDGLCSTCRSLIKEAIRKKANYQKDRGICEGCKRDVPRGRLRGGICGACRNKRAQFQASVEPKKVAPPCSVAGCDDPMELDGRTCLAHRPVFEKIVVSRRPSALDYVWQSRDPLEGCSDGE